MRALLVLWVAAGLVACGERPVSEDARAAREALVAGDLATAEAAAERYASGGAADRMAFRAFVRGNVAFARSLAMEDEVHRPGADARARAVAIARTEDALAAWRTAAASRADWPAARRNVERALLRLAHLREKARAKRKRPPPPKPEDKPPPTRARLELNELPPDKVLKLLDVLQVKEAERLVMRRAARRKASADVERDW